MSYIVSVTSQGQISIPAKIRRELGLNICKKALVKSDGTRMIIEPVRDFLDLGGSFHHKAIKGKSIQEIIKMEKEAVGEAIAEDYRKKFSK